MTAAARNSLAARTVTGVIAVMVIATAAATAVGFWLSYRGLHYFALRAGLTGVEAWAWPSSVDLFIAAGEAGVTIAALRRHVDWAAWVYLAVGAGASVTGNLLHVDPAHLFWTRYAVAAVPPIAAMLALAALLRQVYSLAEQQTGHSPPITQVTGAPSDAADAARRSFAATLAVHNPLTQNQLMERFGLTRAQAKQIRDELMARQSPNGTRPEVPAG